MDMVQGMALMDYIGAYFNYFMELLKNVIDAIKKMFNKDGAPTPTEAASD